MPITPVVAILLAISFGLCGGYLDVAITLLGKYWWNRDGYFRNAQRFSLDRPGRSRRSAIDPWARHGRALPESTKTHLAARRHVAICDTRDLGGSAPSADLRRGQPASRHRAGPADQRQGRGAWPSYTAIAIRHNCPLGAARRRRGLTSGWQAARDIARSPGCRVHRRPSGTPC